MTPCHEHGVWLDGFHVERTGDEEEEEEPKAVRRERRAWPSEEREVTRVLELENQMKKKKKASRNKGLVSKWLLLAMKESKCGL